MPAFQPDRHQAASQQTTLDPTVTVVVCTYNRPAVLEQCLSSLLELDYCSYKIVVVDSAPTTDEARNVATRYGTQYRLAPIRGLSRARNIGAQACSDDIIAFIDDDMVTHRDWLSSLVLEFSNEKVMGVTGPILSLSIAGESDQAIADQLRRRPWGPEGFTVDRTSTDWFERANFGGIGDGNFALRRAVFDWWSGFKENIGRGMPIDIGEEHYAFFQLIDKGYSLAYTPRAVVFHPDTPSTRQTLHNLTQDFAYAGFLVVRHPSFAFRVCRFFLEGYRRKKRVWRGWEETETRVRISTIEAAKAFFWAISLLWREYRGN